LPTRSCVISRALNIELIQNAPGDDGTSEYVERKGLGHPDTICDGVVEAGSLALCRTYRELLGRIPHYNLDKALLVAGRTEPRFGGGRVLAPMRLLLGDRATFEVGEIKVPVERTVIDAARRWIGGTLRHVDPERDVAVESVLQPGSAELSDVYESSIPTANDTSIGVGYAPHSETERLVLEAESHLNGAPFKMRFPASGEDIKVFAARQGDRLSLTVAMALIDRYVRDEREYFILKDAMTKDLAGHLATMQREIQRLDVALNVLDRPGAGLSGVYLTVLGTSAEGADSGEVGRGNRVNGLISFNRPMSLEAAAGKNPVRHVGKLYNLLARHIARRVCEEVEGVAGTTIWLQSRIGAPVDTPERATLRLALAPGARSAAATEGAAAVYRDALTNLEDFIHGVVNGHYSVY
jgi:S-adenosylmethionine synthetase